MDLRTALENIAIATSIILAATVATSGWDGEKTFPAPMLATLDSKDLGYHVHVTWLLSEALKQGVFYVPFNLYSNAVVQRGNGAFAYFLPAAFSAAFGLWQGISLFVTLCYLAAGAGLYLLSRQSGFSRGASIVSAVCFVLSWLLLLEVQFQGSIHRLSAYAIAPFALLLVARGGQKNLLAAALLCAAAALVHPQPGAYLAIISCALLFFKETEGGMSRARVYGFARKAGALLLAVFLLTAHYWLPLALEADYLEKGQLSEFRSYSVDDAVKLFSGFAKRDYNPYKRTTPNYYLGLSVLCLAALGIFSAKRTAVKTFVFSTGFFVAVTAFPQLFLTPLLPSAGETRMLVFAALSLSVLAGAGTDVLRERWARIFSGNRSRVITSLAPAVMVLAIVIIDFLPGPAYLITEQPGESFLYHTFARLSPSSGQQAHRYTVYAEDYGYFPHYALASTVFTRRPYVANVPLFVNPEYSSFLKSLHADSREGIGTYEGINKGLSLLDLSEAVGADYQIHSLSEPLRAFVSPKTILLQGNKAEGEKLFEKALNLDEYEPRKALFVLSGDTQTGTSQTDAAVDSRDSNALENTRQALLPSAGEGREIAAEFDSVRSKVRLEGKLAAGEWVFLSVMHYPLWRASSAGVEHAVFEAGGGLVAIRAAADVEEIELSWKAPWYDYASLAASVLALAGILAYALRRLQNKEAAQSELPRAAVVGASD